jgi:UPF0271 protein
MFSIDLNCDLGEGIGNDPVIMPYISSASIACGYHAGDEKTMQDTIELCLKHNVAVGAHPSFRDKENFGRTEINASTDEVYDLILQQLICLSQIASKLGSNLHHVKPHGALYNMSARNISLARAIAQAVNDFDKGLILYGLSGSHSIHEAKAIGLKTASEVFADRTYQDDGRLTPRSQPGALVEDVNSAVQQALHFVKDGMVKTIGGKEILLVADTLCLHGDGKQAVQFARSIQEAFYGEDIAITKF